jgi:hypothetical protein
MILGRVKLHGELPYPPQAGQHQHDHQQVGGQAMPGKGIDQVVGLAEIRFLHGK